MRIITAFFKYDYGIEKRGVSGEKLMMLPALDAIAEVIPFWLEDNGYPNDMDKLQQNLIKFVKQNTPNLVFFIFIKNEIAISTIKELNKFTKTANWFCDDQWRFNDFSSKVAPYLSYVITVDKFSVDKYKSIGCENVILTQWATPLYKNGLLIADDNFEFDVTFVGGWNLTREWYIYELKKRGIIVKCFGNEWDGGRVSLERMYEIFYTSKVNLNLSNSVPKDIRYYFFLVKQFFRIFKKKNMSFKRKIKTTIEIVKTFLGQISPKNVEQIKARNFEIPGAGGFVLSNYALEIDDYYSIGKDIAVFSTIDELYLQINYYLKNDSKRLEMTAKAYQKTREYTYVERMKKILLEIENG